MAEELQIDDEVQKSTCWRGDAADHVNQTSSKASGVTQCDLNERIDIIEKLHELLDQRPFRPFVIVKDSGERRMVTGRNQLAIGRTSMILLEPESLPVTIRTDSISFLDGAQPAGNN